MSRNTDALMAVQAAAMGEVGARREAEQFAVVLGHGGGREALAIISTARRSPDWRMSFGPSSPSRSIFDAKLIHAVTALRPSLRAVAWVRIHATGGRVDILVEDPHGDAEHLWTLQTDSGSWHREQASGLIPH